MPDPPAAQPGHAGHAGHADDHGQHGTRPRQSLERRASGRLTPEQTVEVEEHTLHTWAVAAQKKKAAEAATSSLTRGWSKVGAFQRR
eukprot:tig00000498_g1594.t1